MKWYFLRPHLLSAQWSLLRCIHSWSVYCPPTSCAATRPHPSRVHSKCVPQWKRSLVPWRLLSSEYGWTVPFARAEQRCQCKFNQPAIRMHRQRECCANFAIRFEWSLHWNTIAGVRILADRWMFYRWKTIVRRKMQKYNVKEAKRQPPTKHMKYVSMNTVESNIIFRSMLSMQSFICIAKLFALNEFDFIYAYDFLTIRLNLFVCVLVLGSIVFVNALVAASMNPHVGYSGCCLNQWNSANNCSGVSSPHSVNVWNFGKWSSIVSSMLGLENFGRSLKSADGFNGRDGMVGDWLQMSAKPHRLIHSLLKDFQVCGT